MPKNPQKIASMRWMRQERDRLLQTRLTFTKSVMVSMGMANLGRMVRNRPDFYMLW